MTGTQPLRNPVDLTRLATSEQGQRPEPRTRPCAMCSRYRAYLPQLLCDRCDAAIAAAEAAVGIER